MTHTRQHPSLGRCAALLLALGVAGCQFPKPADRDAIDAAVDAPGQVQLTLNVGHATGSAGTVTVEPGGATCSTGTCNVLVEEGATVTVTAIGATARDGVAAVSGDCGSLPCTLTMTGPRVVDVDFQHFACGQPSSQRCDLGRLTQCDAAGDFTTYDVPNGAPDGGPITLTMDGYQCPLGCFADGTRCNDVDASNGLNAAMDTTAVSPAGLDLVLPRTGGGGTVTVNTDTFDTTTGDTVVIDPDGTNIRVPATIISQAAGLPEILVLELRSLTVRAGTVVKVGGGRALGIAAHFDIVVEGTIDLSATAEHPGPGSCQALACSGKTVANSYGGGGNVDVGGRGSEAGATGGEVVAGTSPLQGGGGGLPGNGGNGGGALQLVSRSRVLLGVSALVYVSGGGGYSFAAVGFPTGGGGGAGGTVVFQAPTLQVAPGAAIAGRGGSGAAVKTSTPYGGIDGNRGPMTGSSSAVAVSCAGCGQSGAGGREGAIVPGAGSGVAGSGGGSVGRCLVENAGGAFNPPSGMMKVRPTTLPLSTR